MLNLMLTALATQINKFGFLSLGYSKEKLVLGVWDWISPPGARNLDTAVAAAIQNKLLHRTASKKKSCKCHLWEEKSLEG
ncbi:hypothetical protein C5167_015945 [Papaver somniferum]|nr:hypothetical protein C5167_015945 [Papaver somniferum]